MFSKHFQFRKKWFIYLKFVLVIIIINISLYNQLIGLFTCEWHLNWERESEKERGGEFLWITEKYFSTVHRHTWFAQVSLINGGSVRTKSAQSYSLITEVILLDFLVQVWKCMISDIFEIQKFENTEPFSKNIKI